MQNDSKIERMCDNYPAPDFLVETLRAQNVKNAADLYRIVEESVGLPESETEEPILVDLDDDGNEVKSKSADSAWRRPSGEFAGDAFSACHIKQWSSKKQKSRWQKVMTEMRSVYGEEIKVRRAWVQTIIAWAKRKNEGRYAVAITMDNLISAMDNSGYEAFKKQYFEQHREE
jgi:hypothetical protein